VLFSTWNIDPFSSIPIVFVVLFAFGYCVQRYVINFVVRAPILTTFLLTFGLSLLIVNVALLVFHGDIKGITTSYSGSNFSLGPVTIAWEALDARRGARDHGAMRFGSRARRRAARSARWRWTSARRSSPACAWRISTRSSSARCRDSPARPAC
jgi:hypothetical protein